MCAAPTRLVSECVARTSDSERWQRGPDPPPCPGPPAIWTRQRLSLAPWYRRRVDNVSRETCGAWTTELQTSVTTGWRCRPDGITRYLRGTERLATSGGRGWQAHNSLHGTSRSPWNLERPRGIDGDTLERARPHWGIACARRRRKYALCIHMGSRNRVRLLRPPCISAGQRHIRETS